MGAGSGPRTAPHRGQVADAEGTQAIDRVQKSRLRSEVLEDRHRTTHHGWVVAFSQGAGFLVWAAEALPGSARGGVVSGDLESVGFSETLGRDIAFTALL